MKGNMEYEGKQVWASEEALSRSLSNWMGDNPRMNYVWVEMAAAGVLAIIEVRQCLQAVVALLDERRHHE